MIINSFPFLSLVPAKTMSIIALDEVVMVRDVSTLRCAINAQFDNFKCPFKFEIVSPCAGHLW